MATVDQTMMKVQRLLTGPMSLKITLSGESIGVSFTDVSTQVFLRVIDWGKTKDGEPRTLVRISAPVLRSVPPTPQLFEYLAREAPRFYFGTLYLYEDKQDQGKTILEIAHTLLGDYLDEAELAAAMFGVLNSADELDDELQKKFGGKRWVDK